MPQQLPIYNWGGHYGRDRMQLLVLLILAGLLTINIYTFSHS